MRRRHGDGARLDRCRPWWWRREKRVGLAGRGKRGGARTLVATNRGNRWFFVYGFEKNDRANINAEELEALQEIEHELLARTDVQLDTAVEDGSLQEICHEQQD